MSTRNQPTIPQLAEKIALELFFAQPGKDDALLPVNCLLSELEDLAKAAPLPQPVLEAIGLARQWVDATLEAGAFSADDIARMSAWTNWVVSAFQALELEQAPPEFPASFRAVAAAAPPPAAAVAEKPEDRNILRLNLESNGDLLREFTDESHEHLQNIETGVLTLEEKPEDADTLNSIFRAFHTLKGGSGFLNLTPMNRLAHELESVLDLARQHKLAITSEIIDLILKGGDTLKQFIQRIEVQLSGQEPPGPIEVPTDALMARVQVVLGKQVAPPPAAPAAAEPAKEAHPAEAVLETLTARKGPATAAAGNAAKVFSSFVKVDTSKLDNLMDLVGEMVIAQSLVAQDANQNGHGTEQTGRNLSNLGRITNDLQKVAMSLRMVPIRSTFQKMSRVVRDLSAKSGKEVELRLSGEDTELDRNIIEEINDPLVHMVRNAVDHGIETPAAREAAGKPAGGTISLRAFHEGGNICIEIKDDGAGLNRDRILAKAQKMGLVKPEDTLTEEDIYKLIFMPGFSTAEAVTDISGRGVGMDVVRRNIDRLRGKINIESQPGKGSTFAIYLPLTLAIIDGLLVSVGKERFVLPTLSVRESFRPEPGMISTLHERAEMVNVRGRLSPLLRLYEHFALTPDSTVATDSIVVMVESNHQHRCLLVDKLLGKQEVVIKSLGETFKSNSSLAGAAILGDGRVGLILDVNALIRLNEAPRG